MEHEEDDYFHSEEFQDILERYEQETTSGIKSYKDSDELLDIADYYMSQGKYEEAIKATQLALTLHPEDTDPIMMMADIHFEMRKWTEAIEWLNRVLDNNPFDVQAWLNLADSQIQCEQFAEALDSAEYTLALKPDNLQALLQKAYALSRQERYQEASEIFEQYLAQCPDDDIALYHAAFNLCALERFHEANKLLMNAEQISEGLSPEHFNICLQRSYTEARIGNIEEALGALERSKGFLEPDTPTDYNLLYAHIYLMFQHRDKALEYFSNSLSTTPDPINTMRNIAQIFMDCQDYHSAANILKEIEDLVNQQDYQENNADIIKAICPAQAFCYYQCGLKAEFHHYLQMAIHLNPKDTSFFFKDIFPKGARPEDYPFYTDNLEGLMQ